MGNKGNFENRLISLAGEEAVKRAKVLLKSGALLGAWRDGAGRMHGVFSGEEGNGVSVVLEPGDEPHGECSVCGGTFCSHAAALIMYAGRFPQRERAEESPVYYAGLRSQNLAALIERGRRSGAELSIQAQSTAPHVPSKWESMTLRVLLRDSDRESSGNLNNLRKLYFDKTLNVVIRYGDFSLQEQQIIRFLALYGEADGAGIALDSELTAELFHSLVGFPRFFRDGRALAIRGERAEPALLDTGKKLIPGILVDDAPLPAAGAKVIAGRSGCWVGCGRDYFFIPGKCEIGFLRSFFRAQPLERADAGLDKKAGAFQLPVVRADGEATDGRPCRVLCDCALDAEHETLTLEWSFLYPGRRRYGEYAPGSGTVERSDNAIWRRDAETERRFGLALGFFGFSGSDGVAALSGVDRIALFIDSALPELRKSFDIVAGGGAIGLFDAIPMAEIRCRHIGSDADGHCLECRASAGKTVLPWDAVLAAAVAGKSAFMAAGGIFKLERATARWLRGVSKVLRGTDTDDRRLLAFRDVAYFNTLSAEIPGARLPELYREPPACLPPAEPGFAFAGKLRSYQREGVEFMQFLTDRGFGALLADEMGLGKTVQLLAFLASRFSRGDAPALVVCPASLVTNWEREAERFIPGMRVGVLRGPGRRELAGLLEEHDLAILSYASARLNAETLRKRRFSFLILDEAQHIKNPGSGNARSCKNLKAGRRIVLSGTPLENSPEDLWSIMDFLQPGMLGTLAEFRRAYCGTAAANPELKAELAARTAPFIKRRTKLRVAADLPPRSELTLYCELAPAQRALYDRTLEEGRRMLGESEKNGAAVFEVLLRLRQICCHPALLPGGNPADVPSAKTELLMELLDEHIDSSHKMLLFSQFTSLLQLIVPMLDRSGIPYEYLDGATRDRQKHVDRFNRDPGIPLFLLSLKAGGTGLNLTSADTVIIYDPWWNPAVEAQAADRTHRIGQTRPVNILRLVVKDSIEEKILLLQERKRRLFDAVIEDPAAGGGFTLEELRLLLG